jgi:hypothetical protein
MENSVRFLPEDDYPPLYPHLSTICNGKSFKVGFEKNSPRELKLHGILDLCHFLLDKLLRS